MEFFSLSALLASFITIFVILDPFASIPPFVSFTREFSVQEQKKAATKSIIIAGVLALVFLVSGTTILEALHISMNDFKIAGGLVLGLLGLEMVLGFHIASSKEAKDIDAIAVLIATPLLTGPGLISSLVLLKAEHGLLAPAAATLIALVISWILLYNANAVSKRLGENVLKVFSKIMGLMLLSIGISFLRAGMGA